MFRIDSSFSQTAFRAPFSGVVQREFSWKRVLPAVRQAALMRFLEYPKASRKIAEISASALSHGGFSKWMAQMLIKPVTKAFSVGRNVPEAVSSASHYLEKNQQLLLDYVEEMVESPDQRFRVFLELRELLSALEGMPLSFVPIKITALIAPELLEKVASNTPLTKEETGLFEAELQRVRSLILLAEINGKSILIDQEYPHQKETIFQIMRQMEVKYNTKRPIVYATIQAADQSCFAYLKQLLDDPSIKKPAVKLVNGAYVNWARHNGYGNTVQPSKYASFASFIRIGKECMKRGIPLFVGTHNPILERILDDAAVRYNVPEERYVKGQLFGFETKKDIKTLYAIYGSSAACSDYAVRRLMEASMSSQNTLEFETGYEETCVLAKQAGFEEELTPGELHALVLATTLNIQSFRRELAFNTLWQNAKPKADKD